MYKRQPYLYSGARAFIFVSIYEGFGLPPLEAMACGCPVLVSNAASLPEVVGDAAVKTDPYNIEEIALNMMKISGDITLRKKLIERGYKRCKLFSWRKTAEKTIEVYNKVLE